MNRSIEIYPIDKLRNGFTLLEKPDLSRNWEFHKFTYV